MSAQDASGYDLEGLAAPVARGGLLRALVALAEAPGTGGALASKFLNDIGITALRAAVVDAPLSMEHPVFRAAQTHAEEPTEGLPSADATPADLPFETAGALVAAYAAGRTTPGAVIERVIAATAASEAGEAPLRAFIAQDAEDLRAQARAADARYAAGAPLGPLDGVPVAVKDELDVRGYSTTVGTRFLGSAAATADATVVARLRAAGAVIIGKANMHEVGIGVTGINPHHGAARNPYDPRRVTGGSSSGSAVAVAAGLCPISVGADGGGSVRLPAALCGVVGLKATFGRISEHGAAPLCWSVAHVGPLGASVRDVALAYLAMAGPDPADAHSLRQPPPTVAGLLRLDPARLDLTGLRLGVCWPWLRHAEPAVVAACEGAIQRLEARGARVVELSVPRLALLRAAHMVIITSEMCAALSRYLPAHRKDLGLDTRLNLALASHLRATDRVQAERIRQACADDFAALLEAADVILTPTAGCVAPPIHPGALRAGESNLAQLDAIMRFAPAANLLGLPALSVPCGYCPEGLPVGLQIMGPAWSEARLLRVGAAVEADAPRQEPPAHWTLLPSA